LNFSKKRYFLLIFSITICFVQIIIFHNNNQLKKLKEEELNKLSDKIKKCIDIDNKNRRTIYENIKLSEYCIDKFGEIK
tara:strand:- start:137 stop:373 length:237 start_codon:yes stop_codon:yes gene_type:complete